MAALTRPNTPQAPAPAERPAQPSSDRHQAIALNPAIKAAWRTGMASGAGWIHDQPDSILIAIDSNITNFQYITAGFALFPQALAAARPEHRLSTRTGGGERFGRHMRDHQQIARRPISHHRGDEACRIIFWVQHQAGFSRVGHGGSLAHRRRSPIFIDELSRSMMTNARQTQFASLYGGLGATNGLAC